MLDLVEEIWTPALIDQIGAQRPQVSPAEFQDAFRSKFAAGGRVLLTGGARHALRILFDRFAQSSRRRKVLLSAYNCRVVLEAVRGAGLEPDFYDFSTVLGRFNWDAVGRQLSGDHLAVVVPHFFGIPTDFRSIVPVAREKGVRVVEDCAHVLGARIDGMLAGGLGDAAVFSFNYDKPISLAGGGALLINDTAIALAESTSPPSFDEEYRQFRAMAAYLARTRKNADRPSIAARVAARLRIAPYAAPHLPSGIGPLRAAVGLWQLERFDAIRDRRNRNADKLLAFLSRISWHRDETVTPSYLKMRIVGDPDDTKGAGAACEAAGVRTANANWPTTIAPKEGDAWPNATRAARFGRDLPLHQNLTDKDVDIVAAAFGKVRPISEAS